MDQTDLQVFRDTQAKIIDILQSTPPDTLPPDHSLALAEESLLKNLPEEGHGVVKTGHHLLQDLVPGLNGSSLSPTYYGFITGGITPAARVAESLVSLYDQNVCVHLPNESVATALEDRALCMLLELLQLEPQQWPARTLTTGATAGNIAGLGCGREFVISNRLIHAALEVQQGQGILASCRAAGIDHIQLLTTMPHSSLGKAANVVGLGSSSIVDVSKSNHFLDFDLLKLEEHLAIPRTASIVVISCGEVNSGAFATHSAADILAIRKLCDKYGAWLHVDGAFGLFARALPSTPTYALLRSSAAGLEHADSIASDAHKLLNVPYDCGLFFSRHAALPPRLFQNANAAYLAAAADPNAIPSPLNMRAENSARFRGLPVYATLAAYGRTGHADMLARMVGLARKIAAFVRDECEWLELLPRDAHRDAECEGVFMNVLLCARDDALNEVLTQRIKASRKVYASGTVWEGRPAVRFAVAKWDVDVERDFAVVAEVLKSIR